jgi:hypothetical protein
MNSMGLSAAINATVFPAVTSRVSGVFANLPPSRSSYRTSFVLISTEPMDSIFLAGSSTQRVVELITRIRNVDRQASCGRCTLWCDVLCNQSSRDRGFLSMYTLSANTKSRYGICDRTASSDSYLADLRSINLGGSTNRFVYRRCRLGPVRPSFWGVAMDCVVWVRRVYIALDFYTPKLETPELHVHMMHSSTTQRLAHTIDHDETVEQTNVYLDA